MYMYVCIYVIHAIYIYIYIYIHIVGLLTGDGGELHEVGRGGIAGSGSRGLSVCEPGFLVANNFRIPSSGICHLPVSKACVRQLLSRREQKARELDVTCSMRDR